MLVIVVSVVLIVFVILVVLVVLIILVVLVIILAIHDNTSLFGTGDSLPRHVENYTTQKP